MKKLNVTPGEWTPQFVSGICIGASAEISEGYSQVIVNTILPDTDKQYKKEKSEIESNIALICDAGTTYNKCGKLPSELLEGVNSLAASLKETTDLSESLLRDRTKLEEQNRELIEALKYAVIDVKDHDMEVKIIRLITKIENNQS